MKAKSNFKEFSYIFFVLPFIFLINEKCSGQVRLTLSQAIDSVITRNIKLKEGQLSSTLSELAVKKSLNDRLPIVSASPQSSVNWGRTLDLSTYNYTSQRVLLFGGNLETQFTIYQGGRLNNEIRKNKLLLEADKSNLEKIKNDLVITTATVFLQILANEDMLTVARQQVNLANQNVDRFNKELKAGNKSLSDVAQIKAQAASIEIDEATIEHELHSNILELQRLLYMPNTEIELVRPKIQLDIVKTVDTVNLVPKSLAISPDVNSAKLLKSASLQSIKIAQSQYYPLISLFGSIGSNYSNARLLSRNTQTILTDTIGFVGGTNQPVLVPFNQTITQKYPFFKQIGDNFYQSVGISIQIPIFNRLNTKLSIRKAKIESLQLDFNLIETENNFIKIIREATSDLRTAEKKLSLMQETYEETKLVSKMNQKRFEAGLLNVMEFNTSITNFNKTELNLVQARYELLFRKKVIDFYLGKPLSLTD